MDKNNKKFRSAIVGCGNRSLWHHQAYDYVTRGTLVATCDRHPEKRNSYAERFSATPYADVESMILAEKPDLIHLSTWPEGRLELMQLVSDLGVPACIVEKPIACEVSDWLALRQLEQKSQTKFAVCHQFRWHNALQQCQNALNSGKIGDLLFLDLSAGMNISGQGSHILDYAMSLNNDAPVSRVFGTASGSQGMATRHPGPDTTVGELLFANGVRGIWQNGFSAPRITGQEDVIWKHVRVSAYASRGYAVWEEFGKWGVFAPDLQLQGRTKDMDDWAHGNHLAQAAMIEAMYDWILDDQKPAQTNLKLALHQWEVVLALYTSTVYRKPVDLPFDPPADLFSLLQKALA